MIKNYKLFKESVNVENIHKICKEYKIKNYTINDDGSIDVDGDVDISDRSLKEIPINFKNVSGDFDIDSNRLISLKGCPERIGGNFNCFDNELTSLEFGPKYVDGSYYCNENRLKSLNFLPNKIGKKLFCDDNEIYAFKGIPENFMGSFSCYNNPITYFWDLFGDSSKIELFNFYDPLREPSEDNEHPIVVISRLNEFLNSIGKPSVKMGDYEINPF
jgi:hypothetical protein